ncbi:MAG: type II secretion system F family protein [Chloroflexi bacterium]|nr:type II secretion system F family protein [Chloroflexota bacterium]
MLSPIIISILVSLSILLFFVGAVALRPSGELQERMEMYSGSAPITLEQHELQQPFSQRVLRPMLLRGMRIFSWLLPNKQLAKLHHRLMMAGNPGALTTADFVGLKAWTTLIMAGLFFGYIYLSAAGLGVFSVIVGTVFVGIGFLLPDIWLSSRISQRRLAITNALPDALDMLTISVEAGLSFEQGLTEIVSRWNHELAREFRRVLYEVGVGKSRREALERLSQRTAVADVLSFVTAVNHSEELGTSLAQVLNVQAQELRIRRRQRAQEAANKVPIKILFPMVFLIFPAMFAVILGPGVPRLLRALGAIVR